MSYREALRCLKRHVARTLRKTMLRDERERAGRVVRADFAAPDIAVAV